MLVRLTDNYRKDTDSNIGKLLNLVASELEDIKESLETTERYRDIDQATGATLDRIGQNIQQLRGPATDEVYRIMLKSKIARNLSTGDINTIIRVLATTLNTDAENIKVTELYSGSTPEPAAVFIRFPTVLINQIGLSANQFGRIVNRITAAGVRADVTFEGTFAFSSNPTQSETSNQGFADLALTTGGTLSAFFQFADDSELPLD